MEWRAAGSERGAPDFAQRHLRPCPAGRWNERVGVHHEGGLRVRHAPLRLRPAVCRRCVPEQAQRRWHYDRDRGQELRIQRGLRRKRQHLRRRRPMRTGHFGRVHGPHLHGGEWPDLPLVQLAAHPRRIPVFECDGGAAERLLSGRGPAPSAALYGGLLRAGILDGGHRHVWRLRTLHAGVAGLHGLLRRRDEYILGRELHRGDPVQADGVAAPGRWSRAQLQRPDAYRRVLRGM
mmetsp:Transcript_1795/g.7836  ORF Transcript_1795/g.7836 Transcript_1795/m.7836 type:complete len:235 (-) Transcript_1795:1831-2535(-)